MEKTPESLAQEIASMRERLSKVSKAVDIYESVATQNLAKKDIKSKGETGETHVNLFMETDSLMKAVRGPVDMVFSNFENVSLVLFWNEILRIHEESKYHNEYYHNFKIYVDRVREYAS